MHIYREIHTHLYDNTLPAPCHVKVLICQRNVVTEFCDVNIDSVTMLGASAKFLGVLQERRAAPGEFTIHLCQVFKIWVFDDEFLFGTCAFTFAGPAV